jgi:hypothetical protein
VSSTGGVLVGRIFDSPVQLLVLVMLLAVVAAVVYGLVALVRTSRRR